MKWLRQTLSQPLADYVKHLSVNPYQLENHFSILSGNPDANQFSQILLCTNI